MVGVLTLPKGRDRGDSMISSRTTRREGHRDQPISKDVSVARGLLDREALLQTLDRAVTKRITIISAPAGSGKTSLLRTWADRSQVVGRLAGIRRAGCPSCGLPTRAPSSPAPTGPSGNT